MIQVSKPDFSIGKLLATPAALEVLQEADVDLIDLVERHICKDWGEPSARFETAAPKTSARVSW